MSEVPMGAQEGIEQMITPTLEESSPDNPGHGTSIQEVELSLTDLQPWDRIQDLLLPLSNREKELLEQSLLQDGPLVPIYVLPDGRIVDGYHRWIICREHGLTPRLEVLGFSEDDALRIGLFLNIARRQVSPEQFQELKREQKRIYLSFRRQGKTQEEASSLTGVPRQTGARWEKNSGGHDAHSGNMSAPIPDLRVKVGKAGRRDIFTRVEAGENPKQVAADYAITTRQVRRIVKLERENQPKPQEFKGSLEGQGQGYGIITGDLSLLYNALEDESVALFVADPPWAEEYLPLYSQLAELARGKLIPDGLCLAYHGKSCLPQVLSRLMEHLQYYWQLGIPLMGQNPPAWKEKIWVGWRPVLVMGKPPLESRVGDWLLDLAPKSKREKNLHPWQQGLDPLLYWIKRLTNPGDLVVDPFAGTGTTGVACKLLGRHFLGTEVDPERAEVARRRIAETPEPASDSTDSTELLETTEGQEAAAVSVVGVSAGG